MMLSAGRFVVGKRSVQPGRINDGSLKVSPNGCGRPWLRSQMSTQRFAEPNSAEAMSDKSSPG